MSALERISGGASRETYRFVLSWTEDGEARRRRLIVPPVLAELAGLLMRNAAPGAPEPERAHAAAEAANDLVRQEAIWAGLVAATERRKLSMAPV